MLLDHSLAGAGIEKGVARTEVEPIEEHKITRLFVSIVELLYWKTRF